MAGAVGRARGTAPTASRRGRASLVRVERVERLADDGVDAAVEYPVYDSARLARLNERLSAEASAELSRLEHAVAESRKENEAAGMSREMLAELSEQRLVEVENAGPDTVSLLW